VISLITSSTTDSWLIERGKHQLI